MFGLNVFEAHSSTLISSCSAEAGSGSTKDFKAGGCTAEMVVSPQETVVLLFEYPVT